MMILDVMMQRVDDYDTVRRLKGDPPLAKRKVIFLPAKSTEEDIDEARR